VGVVAIRSKMELWLKKWQFFVQCTVLGMYYVFVRLQIDSSDFEVKDLERFTGFHLKG